MSETPAAEQVAAQVRSLGPAGVRAAAAFLEAWTEIETPLSVRQAPGLPGLPHIAVDELRDAAARNAARVWGIRAELYERGISRDEAARRAGVHPNQITNLLRDGDLLAIDGPDGLRLPAWQFDPDARRGRLEGIGRVAAVFPGRVLGLSSWMCSANPELEGRTPREALLDGDIDRVIDVARHIGA